MKNLTQVLSWKVSPDNKNAVEEAFELYCKYYPRPRKGDFFQLCAQALIEKINQSNPQ